MPLLSGAPLRAYIGAAALCCLTSVSAAADYDLTCKSAADAAADLAAHRVVSQALVTDYSERIDRLNPDIHACSARPATEPPRG